MALVKDRMQPSSFMLDGGSSSTPPLPLQFLNLSSLNPSSTFYLFEDDHHPKQNGDDGDSSSDKDTNTAGKSPSPPLSSSSTANHSTGFIGGTAHGSCYGGGVEFMDTSAASLLSFQPIGCSDDFGGAEFISGGYQETTSDWWYGDGPLTADSVQDSATQGQQQQQQQQQTSFKHKRTLMEEDNVQTLKKQCTSNGSSKKQANKPKSSTNTSKDPQSIAAKHRRERISERLKVLQDLVPNGCKVDMVTMLDKAISYVKFLQLQVKVLATDEFWPSEEGKPPNISQVKEAIDAILSSSQGDTPSSTSNDTYL